MHLISWFRGTDQELYITITVLLARFCDLTKAERDDLSTDARNVLQQMCSCWSEIFETLPPGMLLLSISCLFQK